MVAYGAQTEEAVLIDAAKSGDQELSVKVVERYQGAVYNLAYRMLGDPEEAEDAAQEIFVRLYRQLGRYDPERKFSTWTLAIATNYCVDQLRRRADAAGAAGEYHPLGARPRCRAGGRGPRSRIAR